MDDKCGNADGGQFPEPIAVFCARHGALPLPRSPPAVGSLTLRARWQHPHPSLQEHQADRNPHGAVSYDPVAGGPRTARGGPDVSEPQRAATSPRTNADRIADYEERRQALLYRIMAAREKDWQLRVREAATRAPEVDVPVAPRTPHE